MKSCVHRMEGWTCTTSGHAPSSFRRVGEPTHACRMASSILQRWAQQQDEENDEDDLSKHEEELAKVGWILEKSTSQNKYFYFNTETKKKFWKVDGAPNGWGFEIVKKRKHYVNVLTNQNSFKKVWLAKSIHGLPPEWSLEFSNSAKMKYYYNHKTGKRYWRDDKDPEGYAFRPLPNKERETFHVLAAKDALSPASKQKKQKDTVADAGSTPSNKASATDELEDGEILEEGEIVEDSSGAAQTNPTDLERRWSKNTQNGVYEQSHNNNISDRKRPHWGNTRHGYGNSAGPSAQNSWQQHPHDNYVDDRSPIEDDYNKRARVSYE